MKPSDYTNYRITEPTPATVRTFSKNHDEIIRQIADKHIFEHFKQTGKYDENNHMVFEITDDDALDLFNYIVDESNKIFIDICGERKQYDFDLRIEYLTESGDIYFIRKLDFSAGTNEECDRISSSSTFHKFQLNRLSEKINKCNEKYKLKHI